MILHGASNALTTPLLLVAQRGTVPDTLQPQKRTSKSPGHQVSVLTSATISLEK